MLNLETYRGLKREIISAESEISFSDLKIRLINEIKKRRLSTSLEAEDFYNISLEVIKNFVDELHPYVEGYVVDNTLLSKKLINDLYNSITSWGKLTICKLDDSIREIQINGPTIWVDQGGKYRLLRDRDTQQVIKFDNPQEATDFVNSLLTFSGERMTEDEPLVNAPTIEGYRLSCTHPKLFPAHPSEPHLKWPTATIRKISDKVFSGEDLINYNTVTDLHLKYIRMVFNATIGCMFVGTTGCGKTTLMSYGLQHVRNNIRLLSIQAPTEYHYRNMEYGIMQNNAVYWEVDSSADKTSKKSASVDNLVDQTLRYTASYLLLGEMRNSEDFGSGARANNAGTKVVSTFHTNSVTGAIDRYALELVNAIHIDIEMARELACTYLETIVVCDQLGDGSRKVMNISEIIGFDRQKKEYIINTIFEFVLIDTMPAPKGSDLTDQVVGVFIKRGSPHKSTRNNMLKQLISRKDVDSFDAIPDNTVIKEVNFNLLPEDYVVKYDYNVIPYAHTKHKYINLDEKDSVGILL